ncbi:MAG: hypothetical protein RL204_648 [Bacteroidota bacterium]|jgi:hypothetical protein
MLKSIAAVAALLLLSFCSFGQLSPDSVFAKQKLIDDIYSLKKTILDSHPNPFAFCTKDEFNKEFTSAVEQIKTDMPLGEYVVIVSQVLNVLRDSHTGLDFYHIQKMQVNHGKGFIPLRMHSSNGEIFVELDRDKLIPNGSRILCIDNADVSKLYVEALKYANIEGNATTGQRRIADAVFPFVVGLYHPMPDSVNIDFERFGSDSIEHVVYPLYKKTKWEERQKQLSKTEFDRQQSLSFYRHDSVAVLKVGTFAPSDRNKYKKFLTKAFEEINTRNVQTLAIDIRDNSGGQSSNVELLYSFLNVDGHNTPTNIIAKSSKLAKSRNKNLQKGFSRFILKVFFKDDEDVQGFLEWSSLPLGEMDTLYFNKPTVQNEELVYTGKCVLFINGLTASAGVDFTHAFLEEKRGDILGEPCLGPVTGTFGNPALYSLPNTKLSVSISTIRYNYDNTFLYEAKPIKPTIPIDLLPVNLSNGTDPYIQYLLNHLKEFK